jgi:hypothetical protein
MLLYRGNGEGHRTVSRTWLISKNLSGRVSCGRLDCFIARRADLRAGRDIHSRYIAGNRGPTLVRAKNGQSSGRLKRQTAWIRMLALTSDAVACVGYAQRRASRRRRRRLSDCEAEVAHTGGREIRRRRLVRWSELDPAGGRRRYALDRSFYF